MNYYIFKGCTEVRFLCHECMNLYKRFTKLNMRFNCPSNNLNEMIKNHIFIKFKTTNKIIYSKSVPCFANYYIDDIIYKLIL